MESITEVFFFGANALASIYELGGEVSNRSYLKGYALGVASSAGYSYPISRSWNIEAELGLGFVYSKYNQVHPKSGKSSFFNASESKFNIIPSRISFSFVYLF